MSADPNSPDDLRLRLAARRYEALAADPDTFLWAMDPQLRPTGPNEAWEAFTGQAYDDYAAGGWVNAIAEADRDRCRAAMLAGFESEQPISIELAIRRRDGVARRHVFRAIPVRDEQGKLIEWIGTATDVEADRAAIEQQTRAAMTEHREHRELRERLVALSDGAETVLRAKTLDDVHRRIVELAARVLTADAFAVWLLDANSIWRIAHAIGLSQTFVDEHVPGTELAFTEPLVMETISAERIGPRAAKYEAEGIRSLLSVPLPIEGVRRGALVVHYREPHHTTTSELQVAVSLGHLAAAAIGNAEHRDRQDRMRIDAERQGQRMAFLADVSSAFAELDFEASLRKLARLAVPMLGDWCVIDVEDEGGQLRRVAIGHADPEKLKLAHEAAEKYPADQSRPYGPGRVLRTGKTELYTDITDEQLAAGAYDANHLALLRQLGVRSALMAPLMARNRTLGVLTLVSSSPERRYGQADLEFLGVVARRAAMAIDNARLHQETERANRAKDEFLALLSHELRTPLNAIMGWTQLLLTGRTGTDESTRRGLEIIQRNARLQAELVDGLLDVARVSTGGLPLTRAPIEVAPAVTAAVEALRPVAVERGLALHLRAPSSGMRLLADPNRFQQILGNLLSNAVKFTDPGGRIDVTVSLVEHRCEIAVADTGVGIDAAFLPHVFERFRQADSSTTRRHGGLGLGLWLVNELVRAHGGTVAASSPGPGQGATFTVRLPTVGQNRVE